MALTRQASENVKLKKALDKALLASGIPRNVLTELEVPLIEHGPGPDFETLKERLASLASEKTGRPIASIAITSPEAARLLLQAWGRSTTPLPVPVASVGRGTSAVLTAAGIEVAFEPSLANAETLAEEFPINLGPLVLYPASAIAPGTLQQGLESRGFEVERFDSYTTQPVQSLSEDTLALMATVDIVTFGSPSAVKAWAKHSASRPICACIGETSRKAAEVADFKQIFAPTEPGLDSWADVVLQSVQAILKGRTAA